MYWIGIVGFGHRMNRLVLIFLICLLSFHGEIGIQSQILKERVHQMIQRLDGFRMEIISIIRVRILLCFLLWESDTIHGIFIEVANL